MPGKQSPLKNVSYYAVFSNSSSSSVFYFRTATQ